MPLAGKDGWVQLGGTPTTVTLSAGSSDALGTLGWEAGTYTAGINSGVSVEGTSDLSSGFDWSTTPQDFNVQVNDGDVSNVSLTTATTSTEEVVSAIEAAAASAGLSTKFSLDDDETYVYLDYEVADGGAVKIAYLDNWSLSVTSDTAETSQFGKTGKEFINTATSWSGSGGGSLDITDTGQNWIVERFKSDVGLEKVEIHLGLETGEATNGEYNGDVLITGTEVSSAHADKVTFSFNFQGTGPIDYTQPSDE